MYNGYAKILQLQLVSAIPYSCSFSNKFNFNWNSNTDTCSYEFIIFCKQGKELNLVPPSRRYFEVQMHVELVVNKITAFNT